MKNIILVFAVAGALMSCKSGEPAGEATNETTHEATTTESTDEPATVKTLQQSELAAKMKEENVVLIDVRTPGEVAQGHIPGAAQFIDFNGADFKTEIGKLDKSKTYIMYCRSGGRSGGASRYMVENGFQNVYNLQGGIMNYQGELAH